MLNEYWNCCNEKQNCIFSITNSIKIEKKISISKGNESCWKEGDWYIDDRFCANRYRFDVSYEIITKL